MIDISTLQMNLMQAIVCNHAAFNNEMTPYHITRYKKLRYEKCETNKFVCLIITKPTDEKQNATHDALKGSELKINERKSN